MPDINMQVFEEAQRNQLVTEVDIQTQVALDDYQVQLSDIANPTQSQDNVVIDRFGVFLPHWNESLDFDTWIKMSMEIAGKQILMLRGNSSINSASNGNNIFDFWGNSISDFTAVLGTWVDDGGLIKQTKTSEADVTYIYATVQSEDYIVEMQMRPDTLNASDTSIGIVARTSAQTGHGFSIPYNDVAEVASIDMNVGGWWTNRIASGYTVANGNWYNYKVYIPLSSNNTDINGKLWKVGDSEPESYQVDATLTSYSGRYNIGILGGTGGSSVRSTSSFRYFRARQYTAVEPTVTVGAEQNIAVALKSLGRAG